MVRTLIATLLCSLLIGCGESEPPPVDRSEGWDRIDVPGFKRSGGGATTGVARSNYEAEGASARGATLAVYCRIADCGAGGCESVAPTPADPAWIRTGMNEEQAGNPDLLLTTGTTELPGGRQGRWSRIISYSESKQGDTIRRSMFSEVRVWYLGENTQWSVVIYPRGGSNDSQEGLEQVMTLDEALETAVKVFAAQERAVFGKAG